MTQYLMKNSNKVQERYNSINFNSINVGVVWGVVMLIGCVVITGCGLSLKQFWKSWSLWNSPVVTNSIELIHELRNVHYFKRRFVLHAYSSSWSWG